MLEVLSHASRYLETDYPFLVRVNRRCGLREEGKRKGAKYTSVWYRGDDLIVMRTMQATPSARSQCVGKVGCGNKCPAYAGWSRQPYVESTWFCVTSKSAR